MGSENDRDLVERVLPNTKKPFPNAHLAYQRKQFETADFSIIQEGECYRPIIFYDISSFVWFARIIEWEFIGFSVDQCFEKLVEMQKEIEKEGKIQGTIHRYLMVAPKNSIRISLELFSFFFN